MEKPVTIGHLAREAGVKVQTVCYYEQIGLLPLAPRSDGNQRLYDESARCRLAFIRHARELGFSLQAIRDLLSLSDRPEQSCEAADGIAREQLKAVDARIARLTALQVELKRMIAQCAGGRIADCRIIEVLGNHALCAHEHDPPLGGARGLHRG